MRVGNGAAFGLLMGLLKGILVFRLQILVVTLDGLAENARWVQGAWGASGVDEICVRGFW